MLDARCGTGWSQVHDNGWSFVLEHGADLPYRIFPITRGDLTFSSAVMRAEGPWGLCERQIRFDVPSACQIFQISLPSPQCTLSRQAQSRQRSASGEDQSRGPRIRGGVNTGTVTIDTPYDWKATARRNRPLVRVHQPERNQTVLLLLDCGRHMAGELGARRKLDYAVDAVLRLAKVLNHGDLVGVMAFGSTVMDRLPRRKGRRIGRCADALYRVEATLEESDYGVAIDQALLHHCRSLVVLLTDLLDAESSKALSAIVADHDICR